MNTKNVLRQNVLLRNTSMETEQRFNIIVPKIQTKKFAKSLDYWSKHNPLIMAEEIFFESRNTATGKLQFVFSCIGYSLGLGNTWRFSLNCLKGGGGSFLLVYLIMTCLIGLPLIFLELCLSQFTSKGVTDCWNFAPGFKGIGYSMILINLFCCLCYTVILGWILFYAINSLQTELPFLSCKNTWNDKTCVESGFIKVNSSNIETSSEQFWFRLVNTRVSFDGKNLNKIDDNPGILIWYSSSCVIIAWMLSAFILTRGIKIFEKWFIISVIFPYFVMIGIIVLSLQLPGSFQGFIYFIAPSHEYFFNVKTWVVAVEQVFYSLGIGLGGMLTIGSHSDFNRNIQTYVLVICFLNMITALLHGFTVFLILGFMMQKYSVNFSKITKMAGNGLMFFVYPECFGSFRYPNLTSGVFYFMVFIVGIDSMFIIMETLIAGFIDVFPVIDETKYHKICFVLLLHVLCAIFSMIFVTKIGYSWFRIFEKYSFTINLIFVAFFESFVITYIYSVNNVSRDYIMMIKNDLSFIWKLIFYGLSPFLFSLIIMSLADSSRTQSGYSYHFQVYPIWADIFGWFILMITILPIPAYLLFYILRKTCLKEMTLKESYFFSILPNLKWGPRKKRMWLTDPYYSSRLSKLKEETDHYRSEIDSAKRNIIRPKWFPKLKSVLSDSDFSERKKSKHNSSIKSNSVAEVILINK